MSTIYIITDGEYSDYGIHRVFLNRANAEKWISIYGGNIEEWEEESVPEPYLFQASIDTSGQIIHAEKIGGASPDQTDMCELQPSHPEDIKKGTRPLNWRWILNKDASRSIEGLRAYGRTKAEAVKIVSEKWRSAKVTMDQFTASSPQHCGGES